MMSFTRIVLCGLLAVGTIACGEEDTTVTGGTDGATTADGADAGESSDTTDGTDGTDTTADVVDDAGADESDSTDVPDADGVDVEDTDGLDAEDTDGLDVEDTDGAEDTTPDDDGPPPVLCEPSTICDDGNPCTYGDKCSDAGVCAGLSYECDDQRECTDDVCLGNGDCRFDIQTDTCLIGNICYGTGDAHVQNPCVVCDPSVSATEWALGEDGTPCGEDDLCLQNGACVAGQCDAALVGCDDGNQCTDDYCDPQTGCAVAYNFDACDDGDACTQGDACNFGLCQSGPIPLNCDDGEACTQDLCAPDGCVYLPIDGPCEDGSACTVNDVCADGTCEAGATKNCDDGNFCTIDTCDPFVGCLPEFVDSACCVAGKSLCDDQDPCTEDSCNEAEGTCEYQPSTAACDDGDACTGPDACENGTCVGPTLDCDDSNTCTADSCVAALGGCQYQPLPGDCEDNNACTTADKCIGGTCVGTPLNCNDSNPCTNDSCHPVDGCQYTAVTGACDDNNLCTTDTVCTPQGCVGNAVQCNDNNACTNDACNPTAGCQYQPIAAPCDDGLECSFGDECIAGECVADTTECGCIPEYGTLTSKLTGLLIGESGSPGQGLDVDNDPSTCAPAGQCSGGIDNTMAAFAALGNPELGNGFADGDLILMFDHLNFQSNGQPYTLNFFAGKDTGGTCDVQTQNCSYLIDAGSVNPETCVPLISFDNAKVLAGKLTAGGPGYTFPFSLPVQGINLTIAMENAQLKADLTISNGKITAMNGILAGAVSKEAIETAIDQIPDSEFPPEIPKETAKSLIGILIANDIDTNADGEPDAASVGLTFTAIQGTITGVDL